MPNALRHVVALSVLAVLVPLQLTGRASAAEDLAKRYRSTLSHSEQGLTWTSGPEDVWELKSFELRHGKKLAITCKQATVVLGVHDTNVVWAVVFPDKPATISTADDLPGDGDLAKTILLRFAPAEIGRVFPKKTVVGPGDAWRRAWATRVFRHKIGWKWSTPAGNPTIVPGGITIVDVDTTGGPRRFYASNKNQGSVEYVMDFEAKPVPPSAPIQKRVAAEAFDEVWEAFDREYAKFEQLPDVDWKKSRKHYEKLATSAETVFDLAAVIADMLAQLEDLHVWVKAGDAWLPGYTRERPLNASWKATEATIGGFQKGGEDLVWGRTDDGIGYLNVHSLNDGELPQHADAALEELGDTWGLIVDLRFNGGGGEDLAREIAARFVDEERVYSTNRYRSGKKHSDLGPVLERKVAPRGPWRYGAPVVVLWGRKTLSSAESLALMLAQCPQATTMGAPTGGSSGNPRGLELDCGITVNLPRWIDMDPDGNPIEGIGVAPEVLLAFEPDEFTNTRDPVLLLALERLRATPRSDRRPAKGDS